MIGEDVLERGLAAAAEDYDVPPAALDGLRAELAPKAEATRPHLPRVSRRGWWAIGGGLAAGLIALPIALGGGPTTTGESAGSPSEVLAPGGVHREPAGNSGGGTTTSDQDRRLAGAPAVAPTPMPSLAPALPDAASAAGSATGGKFAPTRNDRFRATGSGTGTAALPSLQNRVIKTGQLDLQVPRGEVSSTLNRLTGLATLMGGYIADSTTSEGGTYPSGQVTMRVPVTKFEPTISRARSYGSKVLSLETSSQDVTNKYVDLSARIRALKDTRSTFLTLLSKATTIGETLAVQQHVTDVQTQIEQLQGQLRVLAGRSALSTLTVTVDQKASIVPAAHHESGISQAFHRSVDRFVNGIEAIVGALGPILLAVLLIGFAWVAARVGYRLLRRRMV